MITMDLIEWGSEESIDRQMKNHSKERNNMKRFIILLLLFSTRVSAVEYTVMLGDTHANLQPSGVWWVNAYPHSLPSDVPSFTIRGDQRFGNWGIGSGFMYVGHFRSTAIAKGSDFASASGTPFPLSTFIGDESIAGIFLDARRYFGNFYLEGGPIITHTNWTMDVPNMYPAIPPTYLIPYGYSEHIAVQERNEIQVMPMVAAGYKVDKHWSGQLSLVPTRVYGFYQGITKGYSWNVSVGYTF